MTRKHLVEFAKTIRNEPYHDRVKIANVVAKVCKVFNSEFSRSRFLAACNVDE